MKNINIYIIIYRKVVEVQTQTIRKTVPATLNSLLQNPRPHLTSDVLNSTCGAARPMPSPGDPGEPIHPQIPNHCASVIC